MTVKSIRLTNAIRQNILEAMMASWEKNQPCPFNITKIENKLADDIWNSHFKKLPLRKIPEQMLKVHGSVKVQVAGVVVSFSMSKHRPYPYSGMYDVSIIEVFDEATDAMKELKDAKQKVSEWVTDKSAFEEEVKTILEGVGTTKQLVELWPEAEQYLPPFAADPSKTVNLPALKTSRLNEMLGIK